MPSKQKINLKKVRASLGTVCSKCGYSIPPESLRRVDSEHMECPECHEKFRPSKKV
jgi:NAD-dependent SIR2 family protein deacetylase